MKKRNRISAIFTALILAIVSFCLPCGQVSAVNNNEEIVYNIYSNVRGGTWKTHYTLNSSPVLTSSGARTVIGTDTRQVDFSKSGVVKIITSNGFGTGFIVDGNVIATAAHCVYSKGSAASYNCGLTIKEILVFNTDGTVAKRITNNIKEIHVPQKYISTDGGSNSYDYALVTVSEDLSDYANFNLGIMQDNFAQKNTNKAYTTGFPAEVNNETVNNFTSHKMYTGSGKVLSNQYFDYSRQFCFNNDITPGDSGEPVYVETTFDGKTYYTVIGITTASATSCNVANRISPTLLQFYKNNANL